MSVDRNTRKAFGSFDLSERLPDVIASLGAILGIVRAGEGVLVATHGYAVPDGQPTKPSNVPFGAWVTNDNQAEFRPPDPTLEPGDTVALN